jgi:hypothetical protein
VVQDKEGVLSDESSHREIPEDLERDLDAWVDAYLDLGQAEREAFLPMEKVLETQRTLAEWMIQRVVPAEWLTRKRARFTCRTSRFQIRADC